MDTRKTLRVRDIMALEVFTLVPTTSVEDAARSLTFHGVTGAPVVERGRVVGVVSTTDLVAPRYRSSPEHKVTVREAMTSAVHAVRPGDPAMSAVDLMVREGIHRVVVMSEQEKLLGIISAMDILRALSRGDLALEESAPPSHAEAAPAVSYPPREVELSAPPRRAAH